MVRLNKVLVILALLVVAITSGVTAVRANTNILISGNGASINSGGNIASFFQNTFNGSSIITENNILSSGSQGSYIIHRDGNDSSVLISSNNNITVNAPFSGNDMFKIFDLRTWMAGNQEVPGPGDPNGFGRADIRLDSSQNQVCATLRAFNISTPTAAHIHQGNVGVAGPIVVTLPTPDQNGWANGCVNVDSSLLQNIMNNPQNYYVNIHSTEYPDGAIRGQL